MLTKLCATALLILVLVGCGEKAQHELDVSQFRCPSRPEPDEVSVVVWEVFKESRKIYFEGPPELIEDVSDFGYVSYRFVDKQVVLVVDRRYDFGEVVLYIETWADCHDVEVEPTPTPTLEFGNIPITDRTAIYGAVQDGKCYTDIPDCGSGPCPIEWGREVSCDDWETPIKIEATPTPMALYIDTEGWLEWSHEWTFTPDDPEVPFNIEWSGSMTITDAMSRTFAVTGPVKIRFTEDIQEDEP